MGIGLEQKQSLARCWIVQLEVVLHPAGICPLLAVHFSCLSVQLIVFGHPLMSFFSMCLSGLACSVWTSCFFASSSSSGPDWSLLTSGAAVQPPAQCLIGADMNDGYTNKVHMTIKHQKVCDASIGLKEFGLVMAIFIAVFVFFCALQA